MTKVKIIEHIQSRKGDRLIVEIPKELSHQIARAKENQEIELTIKISESDEDDV